MSSVCSVLLYKINTFVTFVCGVLLYEIARSCVLYVVCYSMKL